MKRVLFSVIPEKGHINPYIGVAQHLQRSGFHVAFTAPRDISEQLRAAGLRTFLPLPEKAVSEAPNRGEDFARRVRDKAWLRAWIKHLLIDQAETSIDAIEHVMRAYAPDIIVTDPMLYPSAMAAQRIARPWVALSNSLNPVLDDTIQSELLDTVQAISAEREALFARQGMQLEFKGCDMLSAHLNIAFCTPAFIGREVPGVHMVGPSMGPGPRGDERAFDWRAVDPDKPLIYMSLGSQIYHQPAMFKKVFDAVANKPVVLLAAVNDLLHDKALGEPPDNVILTHYAPQLEVLRRASVLVTHGGANSVMEAIRFGVPMLISPICNDQFHQAHYITQAGVGIELDLNQCSDEQCADALSRLLDAHGIRERMARLRASYRSDGAAQAAALIADCVDGQGV